MTIERDTAVSNPPWVAQAKVSSPSKAGAREWLGLALRNQSDSPGSDDCIEPSATDHS